MRSQFCSVLGLLFSIVALSPSMAATRKVTVDAGEFDRHQAIVSFALPSGEKGTQLQASDGTRLPLQLEAGGKASFVLPHLAKGKSITYLLATSVEKDQHEGVKLVRDDKKFKASIGNRPLLEYQAEPAEFPRDNIKELFRRGGYIHPILTPSGKMVTDDFPPNHIHHHGVWWAWTHTEFDGRAPDFWNMGDGKGKVEFVAVDRNWSGPVHAGFVARNRFIDLTADKPVIALNEVWEVRIYNTLDSERGWIFDLVSTQECATEHALKLPEYRYGGLGLRGNRAWNGKANAHFLTSEGITDREKGHATRARWCDMSGLVDGSEAGIAVLGDSKNFRAPEPMRIHPDEPFFNFAPMQAGDMSLEPGRKYVWRYRFMVHDGAPNKAIIDAAWNDFANPPRVSVND